MIHFREIDKKSHIIGTTKNKNNYFNKRDDIMSMGLNDSCKCNNLVAN